MKTTRNDDARTAPLYYASGANRPADIRGFAAVGHAIGVAVPELSPAAIAELEALAGRGVPVFVDSGAFSEVRFGDHGPEIVKPITDERWAAIVSLYQRLGRALGSSLSVVAPDCIGNQTETLRRLALHAPALRELHESGVRVLVPIQKGALSQADFDAECSAVLGFGDYVRALPCKKGATTLDELEAFVADVRPRRLHLLGMGIKNRNMKKARAAVARRSPLTELTCDSNWIAANVGRGKRPRLLTRCRDIAARMVAAGEAFGVVQELGIILAFGGVIEPASRALAA